MEVLYAEEEAAYVELGLFVVHRSHVDKDIKEISSLDEVEEEVDEVGVLIALVEFDDQGIVALR